MDSRESRKLLSICRPDRSDLTDEQLRAVDAVLEQDAALREQWAATREWDTQLQAAFTDVPVPAGLADRLLAAASAPSADDQTSSAPGSQPLAEATDELTVEPAVAFPRESRWSRRAILSLAACAAALLLMAGPLAYWQWNDRLTTEFVVDSARTWAAQIDLAGWNESTPPAADYPLDPVLALYNVTWQRTDLLSDSEAVVYRGTLAPDHTTALLFVIRTRQGRALRPLPPTQPDSSTGGLCIGVWKSQGCLYVLVVRGSQRAYLRALRQAYA